MSESHMRRAFSALSEDHPGDRARSPASTTSCTWSPSAGRGAGRRRALLHIHARGAPEPVPRLRRLLRRRRDARRLQALDRGRPADGVTREMLETRRPVVVANARQDPRMVEVDRPPLEDPLADRGADGLQRRGRRPDPARRRRRPARVQPRTRSSWRAPSATSPAVAVTQTRTRLELHSKLEAASRQLGALRRATAVDEQLSDLVLEGRSLQDLTGTPGAAARQALRGLPARRRAGRRWRSPEGAGDERRSRACSSPTVAALPEVRKALAENDGSRAFVDRPDPGARACCTATSSPRSCSAKSSGAGSW